MPFTMDDYNFHYHKAGGNNAIFQISDIDESSETYYYGYLGIDGHWIIMKKVEGACTYCGGQESYSTYWAIRALLEYVQYSELG